MSEIRDTVKMRKKGNQNNLIKVILLKQDNMDTKVQLNKDQQIKQILREYNEKADQIIRQMIGVLTQAHKKADEVSCREWRNKLLSKSI